MIESKQYDFDAIVVGSGISGGWASKELTEKGLKVLVLERGKPLAPGLKRRPLAPSGPWSPLAPGVWRPRSVAPSR